MRTGSYKELTGYDRNTTGELRERKQNRVLSKKAGKLNIRG